MNLMYQIRWLQRLNNLASLDKKYNFLFLDLKSSENTLTNRVLVAKIWIRVWTWNLWNEQEMWKNFNQNSQKKYNFPKSGEKICRFLWTKFNWSFVLVLFVNPRRRLKSNFDKKWSKFSKIRFFQCLRIWKLNFEHKFLNVAEFQI
jgi:uncharacterized protein YkuJ